MRSTFTKGLLSILDSIKLIMLIAIVVLVCILCSQPREDDKASWYYKADYPIKAGEIR